MDVGTLNRWHRLHVGLVRLGAVVLFLVSVPAVIRLPEMTTLQGPDPSWREAYVYFLKTDAQAGVDYTFTYGPLGHFLYPVYDPDLYEIDVAVALVLALLTAIPFVWTAIRRRSLVATLCLGWIAVVIVPWSVGVEAGCIAAIVLMVVLLLEAPGKPPWVYALTGTAFAFLSLTKFPLFILGVAGTVTMVLFGLLQPRARAESPYGALVLTVSFGGSILLFWILADQHPAHLVPFVLNNLALSQSYTLGMHVPMPVFELWLAGTILLIMAVQLIRLLAAGKDSSWQRSAVAVFAIMVLLLTWKLGVVRSQMPKFFIPAAVLSVLLGYAQTSTSRRWNLQRGLVFLVVALATAGVINGGKKPPLTHLLESGTRVLTQAADIVTFRSREATYRKAYDANRRLAALPEIRRIVGDRTIDIFPANQAFLLFNDLNYAPRPVFQGYAACSPELIDRNRAFFDGPDAPDFVLYLPILTVIDRRYPTTEDPEALKAIFRNYRPLYQEYQILLLERLPSEQRLARNDVPVRDRYQGVAHLEEWIELNDVGTDWQLLAIHLSPTLTGRLRSLVFQPPMPWLEVRRSDGETVRGRINIGAIEHGFILNPVFDQAVTLDTWPASTAAPRVSAFRVTVAGGNGRVLADTFAYEVTTVPSLCPPSGTWNTANRSEASSGQETTDGIGP